MKSDNTLPVRGGPLGNFGSKLIIGNAYAPLPSINRALEANGSVDLVRTLGTNLGDVSSFDGPLG